MLQSLARPRQGVHRLVPWHHVETAGLAADLLAERPETVRARARALEADGFELPVRARRRWGRATLDAVGPEAALDLAAVRLLVAEGRLHRRAAVPVIVVAGSFISDELGVPASRRPVRRLAKPAAEAAREAATAA